MTRRLVHPLLGSICTELPPGQLLYKTFSNAPQDFPQDGIVRIESRKLLINL